MQVAQGCDPAPARSGRVGRAGREHGWLAVTWVGGEVAAAPGPAVHAPGQSAPSQPRSPSEEIASRERQAAARGARGRPRPTPRHRGSTRQHDDARTSAHSCHNPLAHYASKKSIQVRLRDLHRDPAGRPGQRRDAVEPIWPTTAEQCCSATPTSVGPARTSSRSWGKSPLNAATGCAYWKSTTTNPARPVARRAAHTYQTGQKMPLRAPTRPSTAASSTANRPRL